ncbi:MAG: hypothetical protein RL695_861 [Pseudomonadota bacterium]|jgi:hypothetical protein
MELTPIFHTAMMPAESATRALTMLRDPTHFQWYVIPLLLIVLYVYAQQIHAQRWSVVFGGLAFWCMDWINEIWNALIFHFTGYAPFWIASGDTAYLILIGLNIEICLMFAVFGVTAVLLLPTDPKLRILGINNRWFFAILNSIMAVAIECVLNAVGVLSWEYTYWSRSFPYAIFTIGYLPFFLMAYWVHDLPTTRQQIKVVGWLGGIVSVSLMYFGGLLGWL